MSRGKPRARRARRAAVQKAEGGPVVVAPAPAEGDGTLDACDLDLDIQGAIYEIGEFAGLVGDEGEDDDFAQLPKEVQLAIHTLMGWADMNTTGGDDDMAEAEPVAPSTALATGQAAAAKIVKEAGPDSTDVGAAAMLGAPAVGPPAQMKKHMVSAHGIPAAKVANAAPHSLAAMHKADHATGKADHTHAPQAVVKEEMFWIDKAEAQQIVYSVVLHPGGKDYHGDEYPVEEIEKAAHKFMVSLQRQRVEKSAHTDQHGADVDAEVIESYIAPQDFVVTNPNGTEVRILKGSWNIATRVNDANLWTAITKGERGGVSIEGLAMRFADA